MYTLNITVNSGDNEYDYYAQTDSVDEAVQCVFRTYPDCTSMVITLTDQATPHKAYISATAKPLSLGPVSQPTSDLTPSQIVWDESGFSAGFGIVEDKPLPETLDAKIKRIYPEYYQQILSNIVRQSGPDMAATKLSDDAFHENILTRLFWWDDTPEGYEFWHQLSKREYKK